MKTILKVALLAATAATPVSVYAQEADGAEEKNDNIIIVTARKKEETLLSAPIAISAFGQEELEESGFENIVDVSKATPGLFIEKFNTSQARINLTPRFRGVFLSSGNRLQQTATVFLDGVPISGGLETVGVNELQRVEIIKGPQSALFGRNTFSGAINYVTKDPGDEFRIDLDVSGATRDQYSIAAGVEGPITDGILFRIGGSWDSKQGHYANFAEPGERLGDESQWNVNASLLIEPSDNFRLKLRGSYREVHDGASAITGGYAGPDDHNFGGFLLDANCDRVMPLNVSIPSSNTQCSPGVERSPGFFGRTNSIFRGTIRGRDIPASDIGINTNMGIIDAFRANITGDARWDPATASLANDFSYTPFNKNDFGLDLDEIRFSADLRYDFSDDISFSFLGGYSEESYGLFTEFDLTPDDSLTTFIANEIEDLFIEGRFDGQLFDDRLTWSVGASYNDIKIINLGGTTSNLFFPVVFGDAFRTLPFSTGAETLGFFGSLDYEFSDQFSVTLEGRYQEDTISDDNVNDQVPGLSPAKLTKFLPRATVRFTPTDATTLYLTYSRGNLPGGFNPEVAELDQAALDDVLSRSPSAAIIFDEEKLENFEFGWKQQVDGGRGVFNLAAFYMKRSDEIFQALETAPDNRPGATNPRRTVTFNGNGATTDIYGFELDANINLGSHLNMGMSIAYIDAKIASFPAGGGTDRFGLVFGPNENPAGQVAPRFPPLSFSTNATYTGDLDFGTFDSWFVRGDMFYSGTYWTSNANLTKVEEAIDVNLRFGLRGEDMSLEFFVTNLLEEDAPTSVQTFANTAFETRLQPGGFFNFNAIGNRIGLRDKRQFGVRAKYTFR